MPAPDDELHEGQSPLEERPVILVRRDPKETAADGAEAWLLLWALYGELEDQDLAMDDRLRALLSETRAALVRKKLVKP